MLFEKIKTLNLNNPKKHGRYILTVEVGASVEQFKLLLIFKKNEGELLRELKNKTGVVYIGPNDESLVYCLGIQPHLLKPEKKMNVTILDQSIIKTDWLNFLPGGCSYKQFYFTIITIEREME